MVVGAIFYEYKVFNMFNTRGGEFVSYEVITTQESSMLTMLMKGENITDIAKTLNVNRGTIYNWLNKESVKTELNRRKQELATQANQLIMRDLATYIDNIKALANQKDDKRVSLAANQYMVNRAIGTPTGVADRDESVDNDTVDEIELEAELRRFKLKKKRV